MHKPTRPKVCLRDFLIDLYPPPIARSGVSIFFAPDYDKILKLLFKVVSFRFYDIQMNSFSRVDNLDKISKEREFG